MEAESILAKKLQTFIPLTNAELSCLSEISSKPSLVASGKELIREGESGQSVFILNSGWACSFKILPEGNRQIIGFPIPGDCVGLRSVLLRTSDHSFSALTEASVSSVEASRLLRLFNDHPRLAAALLWATSRDEAIIVEHLVSVGRRSAIERTAHFFLELGERLTLVGLGTETGYTCPLNQYVLADALGLSAIHVNRVLRQLREQDLMTFSRGVVVLHDVEGLKRLAGFESQPIGRGDLV